MLRLILPICFLMVFLPRSFSQITGTEISYKAIDSFKYEVSVIYYRDCRGDSLGNPSNNTLVRCSGGSNTVNLSLSLQAITAITPFHDTIPNGCSTLNTASTGMGIERHHYIDTLDLNDSKYQFLKSCCQLIIETSFCCRDSAINTGAADSAHYNYAMMDICEAMKNSSPEFRNIPLSYLPYEVPVFMNIGAIDTVDYDSLSYEWGQPLSSYNTSMGYDSFYTYIRPFSAYYHPSGPYPYNSPNSWPPRGLYLNTENGNIIFTPERKDELTVAVVEVKEWRKDSSGTYRLIGVTRRDHQYLSSDHVLNSPPIFDEPYTYYVCSKEQICFDIVTFDPDPSGIFTPSTDTVKLSWNAGIPDATFNVSNPSARLQTGRFCWTPQIEDARTLPYQFTVEARDNKAMNAVSQRAYSVIVGLRPETETKINKLSCNRYAFESVPKSGLLGQQSYSWKILDTNKTELVPYSDAKEFVLSKSNSSNFKKDTVQFKKSGTYIIEHKITNSHFKCLSVYYDTIVVEEDLPLITLKPNFEVCCNDGGIDLDQYIDSSLNKDFGLWDVPEYPGWEKDNIFFADSACAPIPTNMDLRYTYTNPNTLCVDQASIRIRVKPLPLIEFEADRDFCQDVGAIDMEDELIRRPANTNTGTQSWRCLECNGNDFSQMLVDKGVSGAYSDYDLRISEDYYTIQNDQIDTLILEYTFIDAFGCRNTDTVNMQIWEVPVVTFGSGRPLCWDEGEIVLDEFFDVKPLGGVWTAIDTPGHRPADSLGGISGNIINTMYSVPLKTATIIPNSFLLRYEYATSCYARNDTTLLIMPPPQVELAKLGICQEEEHLNLTDKLLVYPSILEGVENWTCIQCNGNDFDDMLVNQGTASDPDYSLNIGKDFYTIQNGDSDIVILQLAYTDTTACTNYVLAQITIYASPPAPTITFFDKNKIYADKSDIIWYLNDSILTQQTGDTIEVSVYGKYQAKYQNDQGCNSAFSNAIHYTENGSIRLLDKLAYELYPNPNSGRIQLVFKNKSVQEIRSVKLYDALGKKVELKIEQSGSVMNINWDSAPGIFYLLIETDVGEIREKIIRH